MKISFFSNFLNHHQVPLCLEFIRLVGEDNFRFICTDPISDERLTLGYEDLNKAYPFVIRVYESQDAKMRINSLAIDSDIAIFTATSFELCKNRLNTGRITYLYIERQFKKGVAGLLHPRVFKRYFSYIRCKKKPLYILCAGAFVAEDLSLFGFPMSKCYKWGYFPTVKDIDINGVISNRDKTAVKLLWCARFISWKRPDMPIRLARDMKAEGICFSLDMYGNGILLEKMQALVNQYKLADVVKIHGSVSNDVVIEAMKTHDIFLFTSNRQEGWGAVANEAMANGCTLVASDDIGAVPYLIENGYNGEVFKSNRYSSFYESVKKLIENRELCSKYAVRSYNRVHELWSARNAAETLLYLNNELTKHSVPSIKNGPCSNA